MKYLAFIFTIYLMGMMVLPCSDAYNECTPTTQANVKVTDNHSHGTDENDNCSPFCNCSCCHTIVDAKFAAQYSVATKPSFKETKFIFTNQRFVSNYYGNIWQPPKLNG